jgi:ABC-type transporter Mla MlaB component
MAAPAEESCCGTIELSGVRTVRTAEQSHSVLLEALRLDSPINLDCSQVTETDVSFVQLLLSARKTAMEYGKSLALAHPAGGALLSVLERGGFLRPDSPAGDRLFWLMSEALDENHS